MFKLIQDKIEAAIQQNNIDNVIVAYSGGSDSQFLLHSLSNLSIPKKAIHINHGLSPYCHEWAQFCQQQAESVGVKFVCEQIDLNNCNGNVEAVARDKRYAIFSQHYKGNTLLVTGHHLDDQAETVLMRLFRGAGVNGLSGIAPISYRDGAWIARPLLELSKNDIQRTLRDNAINWVEDKSNQSSYYDRNFIRNEIFPVIQQRWPKASTSISRSAELCREQQTLSEQLIHQQWLNHFDGKGLNIEHLKTLSGAERHALIRHHISQHNQLMPTQKHMQAIENQIVFSNNNGKVVLKHYSVRKFNGKLYVVDNNATLRFKKHYDVEVYYPETIGMNTRLKINQQHKSLKKLFQEHKVEPWLRDQMPIAVQNGVIIGIGNIVKTDHCTYQSELFHFYKL